MSGDVAMLMSGENAAMVAAIVVLITALRRLWFLKEFFKSRAGERLLPILPIMLGLLATFLGFGNAEDMGGTWQDKVVLGMVAGFTAGQLFKMGRTSIFGWGLPDKQPREKKSRWWRKSEPEASPPPPSDPIDTSGGSPL